MSYSVSTITKRQLSEAANGQSFEVGLAALLNRDSETREVVSVSINEQTVTVVCHHGVKPKK